MPLNVDIARRFGYQVLVPGAEQVGQTIGRREFVLAILDYQDRDRFDPAQDAYVKDFSPRPQPFPLDWPYPPGLNAFDLLALHGIELVRVGGGGMPLIVQMSAAETAMSEVDRVNLAGQRVVDAVGQGLFDTDTPPVIIFVDNFSDEAGARRWPNVEVRGRRRILDAAFFAQHSSLRTRTHELLHVFGAEDVYGGDASRNARHSLMAATVGGEPRSTHLADPWHRMAFGVLNPDIWEVRGYLEQGRSFDVRLAAHGVEAQGAERCLLIWDQGHRSDECLMVELRNSKSVARSDNADSDCASGFVVWGLVVGTDHKPVVGTAMRGPGEDRLIMTIGSRNNLEPGGWDPWVPGAGDTSISTPALSWLSGGSAGFSLTMTLDKAGDFSSGTVRLVPNLEYVEGPALYLKYDDAPSIGSTGSASCGAIGAATRVNDNTITASGTTATVG